MISCKFCKGTNISDESTYQKLHVSFYVSTDWILVSKKLVEYELSPWVAGLRRLKLGDYQT